MEKLQVHWYDGQLNAELAGYRAWLVEKGYARTSMYQRLLQLREIMRWLMSEGLSLCELDEVLAARFLEVRRDRGTVVWISAHCAALPLEYLRYAGIVPVRPVSTVEDLWTRTREAYRHFLVSERALAPGTIDAYVRLARSFCTEVSAGPESLCLIRASDVSGFVVAMCGRSSPALAKKTVTAVAAFLKYLFVIGISAEPLAPALPKIPKLSPGVPVRGPVPSEVDRLLASCDRNSSVGRRNYAVMLLLSRLGLRSSEVAALRLDDIDWHHGNLLVRGKGDRWERLPLPVDVGAAVAEYLVQGRPAALDGCRSLFLQSVAPHCQLSPAATGSMVARASRQAGIGTVSPHRLRHSAATTMAYQGVPLQGVAQVLRHHGLKVTASYIAPELDRLRELAPAWPGST